MKRVKQEKSESRINPFSSSSIAFWRSSSSELANCTEGAAWDSLGEVQVSHQVELTQLRGTTLQTPKISNIARQNLNYEFDPVQAQPHCLPKANDLKARISSPLLIHVPRHKNMAYPPFSNCLSPEVAVCLLMANVQGQAASLFPMPFSRAWGIWRNELLITAGPAAKILPDNDVWPFTYGIYAF